MRFSNCPKCGTVLSKKEIGDEGLVPFCDICNRPYFDVMYPCVIVLVVNEKDEVCVIKQSYGADRFVLVAGFVKIGNTIEQTIEAEVFEEIGQRVFDYQYVESYYQQSNENLMLGFIARVKETPIVLSSELTYAKFIKKDEALELLRNANIAFKLLNKAIDLNLI